MCNPEGGEDGVVVGANVEEVIESEYILIFIA